jgi:hypothetical protein
VRGRDGERISEYFDFARWPEKADKKVTRHELQIMLARIIAVQRDKRWYRRLWRFLRAKTGSGPQVIPEPQSEKSHGE